jgi:hypothetical protein
MVGNSERRYAMALRREELVGAIAVEMQAMA